MTTQEFIRKMAEDKALANKMSECKSPEEAYETAKGAGLTDDIETFKAVMTAVNKKIKGELSDDELDNVAGGMSDAGNYVILALTAGGMAASMAA
ncbi:MAG: Nif11-like leader peptide family RiPP precursor [Oscillospiraceae bacterium]